MPSRTSRDIPGVTFASALPTARQRAWAVAAGGAVLLATAIIMPLGALPLPQVDGFIPASEAVLVICDLVIASLLYSHARALGLKSMMLLASGFLFDGLIIVPHALTFPGAFAPDGLLGAGLQTTSWLFIFWHLALPIVVIGYVCMPRQPTGPAKGRSRRPA